MDSGPDGASQEQRSFSCHLVIPYQAPCVARLSGFLGKLVLPRRPATFSITEGQRVKQGMLIIVETHQ
jgi:hypothetical protein